MHDSFNEILHAAELKATPARLELMRILQQSGEPLSASEIIERFKARGVDQATVYRNLSALSAAGVIRQIDLRHSHAHYELASDDHHHLVCRRCGTVEDFHGCDARSLITKALRQSSRFEQVDDHAIELYGICKKCL